MKYLDDAAFFIIDLCDICWSLIVPLGLVLLGLCLIKASYEIKDNLSEVWKDLTNE